MRCVDKARFNVHNGLVLDACVRIELVVKVERVPLEESDEVCPRHLVRPFRLNKEDIVSKISSHPIVIQSVPEKPIRDPYKGRYERQNVLENPADIQQRQLHQKLWYSESQR